MFRLDGSLIDGKSAYSWLSRCAKNVSGEVSICSAFLRSQILKDLSHQIPNSTSVRVMARWQIGDLLAGASDLESYKVCTSLGWRFFVSLSFHGKLFHLPPHGILVGSANATHAGFGLMPKGNLEACTVVPESSDNIRFVDGLFAGGSEINDSLFGEMEEAVNHSADKSVSYDWPYSILQAFSKRFYHTTGLFLNECFKSNGAEILSLSSALTAEATADLSLLGLTEQVFDLDLYALRFKRTKIFYLLMGLLERRGGEVYFGALSAAVHDWLLENPAPHRVDIKILVKNLYGWIAGLGIDRTGLYIDRPNHSERIKVASH